MEGVPGSRRKVAAAVVGRILDVFGAQLVRIDRADPARHPAPDVTALADPTGTLDEWFARAGALLALLRPGYAYAIFHPHATAPVLQRFAAGLGRPPA